MCVEICGFMFVRIGMKFSCRLVFSSVVWLCLLMFVVLFR